MFTEDSIYCPPHPSNPYRVIDWNKVQQFYKSIIDNKPFFGYPKNFHLDYENRRLKHEETKRAEIAAKVSESLELRERELQNSIREESKKA
jgi:hypothetical protein